MNDPIPLPTQTIDMNKLMEENSALQRAVHCSVDAMSRVYGAIFMARQIVLGREHLEESTILFGATIRDAVRMISNTYPDFEQFKFDVKYNSETNDLSIVGINDFTNSVLFTLQQTLQGPVIDHVTQDIPKPLPLLGGNMLEMDDEYLDEEYEEDDHLMDYDPDR